MTAPTPFSVVLLHDPMVNKEGRRVTTSLTLIDVHDFARSCCTYGVDTVYIAHPAPALRKLARKLHSHWEEGFGATYNPNRKEALERIDIVSDLDEAVHKMDLRHGKLPKLIATSAKDGGDRLDYATMQKTLRADDTPHLLMFGTGWGMADDLLERADYFLAPLKGPGEYNHLSVRAACAIILDRLFGS